MKTAGVDDRVKVAAQTIYQAWIDAELTRRGSPTALSVR